MKTQKVILTAFTAALLLSSQLSSAANNNANANSQPGNPFDELRELIAENRDLIETNRGAIAALGDETDAINARIDTVEAELADVAAQVSANSADISAAFTRIAAVEGNVEVLRNDLGALSVQHQEDVTLLELRLNGIQAQIDELVVQSTELTIELNARVAELRGLIPDNSVGIDALVLDISLLNAQVGSINTSILALGNQQTSLEAQVAGHSTQLVNLTAALDALKSRVSSYHDPCLEFIAFGDTVNGELVVNDGECLSDSRNYSPHLARYYTFTLASLTTVTIEMDGQQCKNSGTLSDPYLFLHLGGRDGAVIASNDDSYRACGWTLNSRITQTLEPGTYTIEATSWGTGQYGTFQLSVQ